MSENIEKNDSQENFYSDTEQVEDTKIPLQEVIEAFIDFYNGKLTEDDLNEYGKKIKTFEYIKATDKMIIAMSIVNSLQLDLNTPDEMKIINMYKDLFFYGLLGYTNIDNSNKELFTFNNYDMLYPVFAPLLLGDENIKRDYELLQKIIESSINIGGITKMLEISEELDYNSMTSAAQSNKELIEYMENNKGLMDQLNTIAQYNNPLMSSFVEGLRESALSSKE